MATRAQIADKRKRELALGFMQAMQQIRQFLRNVGIDGYAMSDEEAQAAYWKLIRHLRDKADCAAIIAETD